MKKAVFTKQNLEQCTAAERVQYFHAIMAKRHSDVPMLYFRRLGVNYERGMFEVVNCTEQVLEMARFAVFRVV